MTLAGLIVHSAAPAPSRVRAIAADDLDELVSMCGEHARFEKAVFATAGKAKALGNALFAPAPRLHAWIALCDGRAVGYATASSEFSTWSASAFLHMDCLFVREGFRDAGVGADLLAAVIKHARTHGLHQLQWQTPHWNHAASRFYRRQGATEQHKRRFILRLSDTDIRTSDIENPH